MELLRDVAEGCAWAASASLPLLWRLLRYHWTGLLWAVGGILAWTVTKPLWFIGGRLSWTVFGFAYKWASLTKMSILRYRRLVSGPSLRDKKPAERRWKMYEALWLTHVAVLEAKKEHEEGLGRLLHKWLEAFHALWCVFLPDVLELSCRTSVKYWVGSRAECRRTVDRAMCVVRGFWAFVSLLLYAIFYTVVYIYEIVEWSCWGSSGVGILLVTLNYLSAEGNMTEDGGLTFDEEIGKASGAVVAACMASCLLRWYESTAGGKSPMQMASDRYAKWCKDLEEQEQAERLSDVFWRQGGCVGPKRRVRTLSETFAERKAIHDQVLRHQRAAAARRGRRVSVGEDVTSENGGHRLGRAPYRPSSRNRTDQDLFWEDRLGEDPILGEELEYATRASVRGRRMNGRSREKVL